MTRSAASEGRGIEVEVALAQGISFEEFYEDVRRPFFRALLALTHDRAEAEDVMQDAFCRVLERWDRVGTLDDPAGYLFRVGLNRYRSGVRRAMRAATRTLAPREDEDPVMEVIERDEAAAWLRSLTRREREAVVTTGILGLSTEDAAAAMGVRPGTVRMLVSTARARIEHDGGDDG